MNLNHIRKTFTKQISQYYCGLACLNSIIKYHGGESSQEKLRESSGTTLQGTSLLGLYQSAQSLGFEAKGYEADIENLKKTENPVILHILKDNSLEHYVVCYGFNDGKFVIGDPAWGIIEYREEELELVWKSKIMLTLNPGKGFIHKQTKKNKQFLWFKELIKDDIPILLAAAFIGVILAVLGLAVAIYTQKLIDHILPSSNSVLLFKSLAIFILVLIAKAFIGYIRGIFLVRQSKDMNVRMVSSFFGKLLYLPKSLFDSTSTGDMVGRLNDSQRIQRVVITLSNSIIIDVLIIVSSLVYVFMLSTSTALLALLTIPFFGALAIKYNRKVIDHQKGVMESYALTESKYIDAIQGIKVIKSGNKEGLISKSIGLVYNFFQGKVYELGMLTNKINLWIQLGSAVVISGMIAWTSFLVLKEQLLLGQMMAIITIVGAYVTSVINTAMANIQFQEAKVAFERMYEFAAIEPEYTIEPKGSEAVESIDLLELKGINFRFPGKSKLLEDIKLKIKKGQFVTIFGEIGCGKSTLVSILQRFYKIESGDIYINGTNWDQISTPEWRKQIGAVSQHIKLFNGTILENICMEEQANAEEVIAFCKEIGMDAFINEFQQGYYTVINENSTNLSGGQQQLVALARSLYQKPKVLLLDEATAAMDKKTEEFVLKLLKKLKKDLIIVFVTHRVQLARHSDMIYCIENKRISVAGQHNELVSQKGIYSEAFKQLIL